MEPAQVEVADTRPRLISYKVYAVPKLAKQIPHSTWALVLPSKFPCETCSTQKTAVVFPPKTSKKQDLPYLKPTDLYRDFLLGNGAFLFGALQHRWKREQEHSMNKSGLEVFVVKMLR